MNYNHGYYTIIALSVGGPARLVIRLAELLEWQACYVQEKTAELNRKNASMEAEKLEQPYYQVIDGQIYPVVKDEEMPELPLER